MSYQMSADDEIAILTDRVAFFIRLLNEAEDKLRPLQNKLAHAEKNWGLALADIDSLKRELRQLQADRAPYS